MERDSSTHCLPYLLSLSPLHTFHRSQMSQHSRAHLSTSTRQKTNHPKNNRASGTEYGVHYWSARKGWAPTIYEAPTADERCPTTSYTPASPTQPYLIWNYSVQTQTFQILCSKSTSPSIHALAYWSLPCNTLTHRRTPMSRMSHARATYDNSLVLGRAVPYSRLLHLSIWFVIITHNLSSKKVRGGVYNL